MTLQLQNDTRGISIGLQPQAVNGFVYLPEWGALQIHPKGIAICQFIQIRVD